MLRKLDSRREVLCIPGLARRPVGDLVDAWAAGLAGKVVSVPRRPVADDQWPAEFPGAGLQPGWANAIRDWGTAARGAGDVRRSGRAVCAVSRWYFRGLCRLFARREMGCICVVSGGNALAQPRRRQRAAATHRCPDGSDGAEVVSRWQPDCVLRYWRGQTAKTISHKCGWRHTEGGDFIERWRNVCALVAGWRLDSVQRLSLLFGHTGEGSGSSVGFEDAEDRNVARFRGILCSNLVSRWKVCHRDGARRPAYYAIRLQDECMERIGEGLGPGALVAGRAVLVFPALWTRVRRDADSVGQPASGRSGEFEGNTPGRAAGRIGVWLDAGWGPDCSARCGDAGGLFAGLGTSLMRAEPAGRNLPCSSAIQRFSHCCNPKQHAGQWMTPKTTQSILNPINRARIERVFAACVL